ncbi:MAG TPA: response regulator [Gemmatimonadales bacterium]
MQSAPVVLPAPTILVVDDEPAVCGFAARVLAEDGYRVITAADGIGALQVLESYPSVVQLIVTDVAMPNMSGAALAQELTEWPAPPPIVFISGSHGHLGLPGPLLRKPFRAEALSGLVRQVLGEMMEADLPKLRHRLTAGSGWRRDSHQSLACSRLHSSPS